MDSQISSRNITIFIIVFCLFHVVLNLCWLSIDEGYPDLEDLAFRCNGYRLVHEFQFGIVEGIWISHYPPLTACTIAVGYLLGIPMGYEALVNVPFLFLLLFSLFHIGRIVHSDAVGLLAIVLCSFFPIVMAVSRICYPDFILTALIAFSILALLKSDGFNNRRWSLLFGLGAGFGMLSKWTWPFFIIGVFIYVFRLSYLKEKQRLLNLSLAGLTAFVIAGPWYLTSPTYLSILMNVGYGKGAEAYSAGHLLSLQNLLFYFYMLNNFQIGFILFVCFTIVTGWAVYNRVNSKSLERGRAFTISLLWFSTPFLLFTFVEDKGERFLIPALPAVALLIASGLSAIPWKSIRSLAVGALMGFVFLQFLVSSFPNNHFLDESAVYPPVEITQQRPAPMRFIQLWGVTHMSFGGGGRQYFRRSVYYIHRIIKDIREDALSKGFAPDRHHLNIGILSVSNHFHSLIFDYETFRVSGVNLPTQYQDYEEFGSDNPLKDKQPDADYLITKSRYNGPEYGAKEINRVRDELIYMEKGETYEKYDLMYVFPMSDGSNG